jgi:hypothetical protein
LRLADGTSYEGDSLVLWPEGAPRQGTLSELQIRASGIPKLVFTQEQHSVQFNGLVHGSLGSATLTGPVAGATPTLTVSNLGSSGQDGVAIQLNQAQSFEAHWQDLDAQDTLPLKAFWEGRVIGAAGTINNGLLAVAQLTKAGTSNYLVSVDFTPLKLTKFTAEVYRGSSLVGQWAGGNGPVASAAKPNWDLEMGWDPDFGFYMRITWHQGSGALTTLRLTDGTSYEGDSLVLWPEGAPRQGTLSELQIRASGIPKLVFTQEQHFVQFNGLVHGSLGSATLTGPVAGATPTLTVSNLGSSGQDGVAIQLNQAQSFEAHWQDLDAQDALPLKAFWEGRVIGTAGAVNNGLLAIAQLTKAGTSNYLVSADFTPLNLTKFTAEVYQGSTLVGQWAGGNGPVASAARPNWDVEIGWDPERGFFVKITWHRGSGTTTTLRLADGTLYEGDSLVLWPEGAPRQGTLSELQMRASGIPKLVFTMEQHFVQFNGLVHGSLGSATLTAPVAGATPTLTVSNLGSSGQDGVAIAFPPITRWDGQWLDVDSGGLSAVGSRLQFTAYGATPGSASQPVATVRTTKTGTGNFLIAADFSTIGSSNRTVEIYNGTNLVSKLAGQSGLVGTCSTWPRDLHISCCPLRITVTWNGGGGSGGGTLFTLNGGGTSVGDSLVLTPENPDAVAFFTQVQIQAAGLASLQITDEDWFTRSTTLHATASKGMITIAWDGAGGLQESTDLIHWTQVPNAASPYQAAADGQKKFYRVAQ